MRLLRRLGFRWAFPIGTLAVPVHPLMLVALLASPLLWLAIHVVGLIVEHHQTSVWPAMLAAALLLAIPLSTPIVAWFLTAFLAPLAQSLLFAAAIIAIVAEVATGVTDPVWLVLPISYAAAFAIQFAGGRLVARHLRAEADAFVPVNAAGRDLVLRASSDRHEHELLRTGRCARVFVASTSSAQNYRLFELIAHGDAESILELGDGKPPPTWALLRFEHASLLQRPVDAPPEDAVILERRPYRSFAGLLAGTLAEWSIRDGGSPQTIVSGKAKLVTWPLAMLFRWTSLRGPNTWVTGFLRRDLVLGSGTADALGLLVRGEPPVSVPSPALIRLAHDAFAEAERVEAERQRERESWRREQASRRPVTVIGGKGRAKVRVIEGSSMDDFWRAVSNNPMTWSRHSDAYRRLLARSYTFDREDLRRTLNWVEAAAPLFARDSLTAAARLLAMMPETLLANDYPRLLSIFNSRTLGMVWHLTANFDRTPLPQSVPVFGDEAGFGLIRSVPELYLKLSLLGPETEEIVIGLAEEAVRYGISLPEALNAMARPPSATR